MSVYDFPLYVYVKWLMYIRPFVRKSKFNFALTEIYLRNIGIRTSINERIRIFDAEYVRNDGNRVRWIRIDGMMRGKWSYDIIHFSREFAPGEVGRCAVTSIELHSENDKLIMADWNLYSTLFDSWYARCVIICADNRA